MKTLLKLALVVAVIGSIGCAREKKNGNVDPAWPHTAPPTAPPREADAVTDFSYGSTTDLEKINVSAFREFFFQEPVNNPTNVRINVNLSDTYGTGGGYGGDITITFYDNGRQRTAMLTTRHPCHPEVYNSQHCLATSNTENNQYNVWFNSGGKEVFHGFFQDAYGAIVVVIDKILPSQGDGFGTEIIGGSVYFQNFGQNGYNNPYQGVAKNCWTITAGPYDCRTFISGGGVVTTSAIYPNNHGSNRPAYQKLGEFNGLSRSKAFNE